MITSAKICHILWNRQLIGPLRDIRYFSDRLSTAQLVSKPANASGASFGNIVRIEYDDGREFTYQIVGEDQADPAKGLLSYVSPMARSLAGKSVGDVLAMGKHEIEILEISQDLIWTNSMHRAHTGDHAPTLPAQQRRTALQQLNTASALTHLKRSQVFF